MFTIYGVCFIEDYDWEYFSTKTAARERAVEYIKEEAKREHWSEEELDEAMAEFKSYDFADEVVGVYDLEVN